MKISVTVPNGDMCTGCDFLVKSSYEDACRVHTEKRYCAIFKTDLSDGKKCIGCKNCQCM